MLNNSTANFEDVCSQAGQKMKRSNTFKQKEGQRSRMQGREGWKDGWIQATDLLYICARIRGISLMMPAQEKGRKIYLSFYLACSSFALQNTAHIVSLSPRIKLAGWVRMFPHPVQFEKQCDILQRSLFQQPLPRQRPPAFNISFTTRRSGELSHPFSSKPSR